MNDLATPAAVPAPVTPATDRLIRDSTSANTRRAYAGALARLLAARPLDDAGIAEYLGTLDAAGKSPATASMSPGVPQTPASKAGCPGTRSESAQPSSSPRPGRAWSKCRPPAGGPRRPCPDGTPADSAPPVAPWPGSGTAQRLFSVPEIGGMGQSM